MKSLNTLYLLIICLAVVACAPSNTTPDDDDQPTPTGGPAFSISSPTEGAVLAGPIFFAITALNPAEIQSVSFQAGDRTLTPDPSLGESSARVFLLPQQFADGPLQLTATVTGSNGQQNQKSISVMINNNPLEETVVSAQGATLGTREENGALSVLTIPAGVAEGVNVGFKARTQDEVKTATGVDYDGLGVTFLGAQEIESATPIDQTLMVSSGGFGPRVKQNEAVVNYVITPDADGDGNDEIVVVNTATVAPNGDVISDALSSVLADDRMMIASRSGRRISSLQSGTSVQPGDVIEMTTTGLNPYAPFGTGAFFYSPSSNSYAVTQALVEPHPDDRNQQLVSAVVPQLAAGDIRVGFVNYGNKTVSPLMTMTLAEPPPLSGTIRSAYNSYFDEVAQLIEDSSLLTEAQKPSLQMQLGTARSAFNEALDIVESGDEANEAAILATLEQGARLLQNLPLEMLASQFILAGPCDFPADAAAGLGFATVGVIGAVVGGPVGIGLGITAGAASLAYTLYAADQPDGVGAAADYAGTTVGVADALSDGASTAFSTAGSALAGLSLAYNAYGFANAYSDYSDCDPPPMPPPGNPGDRNFTGMGSIVPAGGSGPGFAGGGGSAGLRPQQNSSYEGRISVKVFANGAPFTGVTDSSGYFYLPIIPEGPFEAIAIDRVSGETRRISGVAPAVGDAVFLFFDFFNPDGGVNNDTIVLNSPIIDAITSAGQVKTHTLSLTQETEIFFDLQGADNAIAIAPVRFLKDGEEIFATNLFNSVTTLDPGRFVLAPGDYVLEVGSSDLDATGAYQFTVFEVLRQSFALTLDSFVEPGIPDAGAGTISRVGAVDSFTFSATPGQELYFTLDTQNIPDDNFFSELRLFDSSDTLLFNGPLFSLGGVEETRYVIEQAGNYRLEIGGDTDLTGDYVFGVFNVLRQQIDLPLDQPVSANVPVAGAGIIESPGDVDEYHVEGQAGQKIFPFFIPEALGEFLPLITLEAPDGSVIVDSISFNFFGFQLELPQTGRYTLRVQGLFEAQGGYSFGLYSVDEDSFDIVLGQTISDGNPAAGAGNIETIGDVDSYRFVLSETQEITLGGSVQTEGLDNLSVEILDASGDRLFDTLLGFLAFPNSFTLEPGNYTLVVGRNYVNLTGQENPVLTGSYTLSLNTAP